MKIQSLFILLLLASCTNTNQQNSTTEKQDSVTVTSKNVEEEEITTETKNADKKIVDINYIKASINEDFKNIGKATFKNEFGGGDCLGTYQQSKIQGKTTTITVYEMDCGEYSFTNYRLIASEDNTPLFLEKVNYENYMTGKPQKVEEWLIDFQDTSKVYYRTSDHSYETKEIPNDVAFQIYEGNSLNISEGLLEIKSGKTEELY